jgi:hypothetical protein
MITKAVTVNSEAKKRSGKRGIVKARVKNRQFIIYTLVGVIIVAFITFGVADAHGIKDQLNSWKLLPQPERLTELYYVNPNNLPSTYTPGVNQSFDFTVHNLEYRNTDYTYQVEEQSSDGSQTATLTQGSFWLNQNDYKTVSENINISNMGTRVKVIVNLTNVNESIDYWVNRSAT